MYNCDLPFTHICQKDKHSRKDHQGLFLNVKNDDIVGPPSRIKSVVCCVVG